MNTTKETFEIQNKNIVDLLKEVGVPDDELIKILNKTYYWSFFISVSAYLVQKRHLTEKQYDSVVRTINNKFNLKLPYYKLRHETQYNRESATVKEVSKKQVEHNFDYLKTIQIFDLPFNEGEEISLKLYEYNKHSCVISYNNSWYKIPTPTLLEEVKGIVEIDAKYHRTAKKGFLKDIKIKGVTNDNTGL